MCLQIIIPLNLIAVNKGVLQGSVLGHFNFCCYKGGLRTEVILLYPDYTLLRWVISVSHYKPAITHLS